MGPEMSDSTLVTSGKQISVDEKFEDHVEEAKYANYLFTRLVAKDKNFTKVRFRYSFFESSYLRDCHFDSCDFTGCRFVNTNLSGSKFSGCKFDYATFEKTLVDPSILETECPGFENLKLRFARSLRTNYQQIGDASAANKAMNVELAATATHLNKAAWSNEAYYRKHYRGLGRLEAIIEWGTFNILDFIWGNGENVFRLFRFVLFVLAFMTVYDIVYHHGGVEKFESYWASFGRAFAIFFGTQPPDSYSPFYLALVTCVRLVLVGFFLSVIIKRFNRR
jgi:Pentapeptide repeats (9 copies)